MNPDNENVLRQMMSSMQCIEKKMHYSEAHTLTPILHNIFEFNIKNV